MEISKIKTPIWYWVVTVFFLLWNFMGVISFYTFTFISEDALASLPDNERALYGDYPLWTTFIFAMAVFFGLLGSIGLILKKNWSQLAFIISLCAIVPQMIHNVFFTRAIEVYGLAQAVTMPLLVVIFGLLLIWFSGHVRKMEWYK